MNITDVKKWIAKKWYERNGVVVKTDDQVALTNPVDIKIGSCFTLKSNVSLIYKTLFTKQEDYDVSAIGIAQLTPTVKMFRFYDIRQFGATLTPGDNFLQILVSTQTFEILESRMFMLYEEKYPRSNAEWLHWIENNTGAIGLFDATVADRQFSRMEGWSDVDDNWSPPKSFTETIHEGFNGEIKSIVKHDAMQYGRWAREEADGVAEYVILSNVAITANSQSKRFAFTTGYVVEGIGVYVGIDMPVTNVVVNF